MNVNRILTVAGVVICAAAVIPTHSSAQSAPAYYTAAQAAAGAKLFAADCAMCHGAKLEGTSAPALAGDAFLKKFSGQTAADVHAIVSTQMPLTAPASLKPAEYIDLMAFILQKNAYPAGDTPLEAAKLKSISFK